MLRLAASRGGPRNALGHRPEPEVLPLPAETSREAPKCCAWQRGGGAKPSAAPGSIKGGSGPETRSGSVQSLKCCPASRNEPRGSQVLRLAASRLGPRNALGYRPEPEVLPLPAETSREAPKCCAWQHQGGGPRNALGYRPEPEVLPLPAETSREAPKCCAWQHQGGGPRNALGHRPEPEVLREAPKCVSSVKRARAPSVCVSESTWVGVSSVCVEEGERRSEEELGARRRSVGWSVVGRSVGRRREQPQK